MAATAYHHETVRDVDARLRQIRAVKYEDVADNGDDVYQSSHGWITVHGRTLTYWTGCPC